MPVLDRASLRTRTIHGGTSADPATGALLTPLYQTTTFRQEAVGKHKGFTYTRSGNPTVRALEDRLAAVEGAPGGAAFATGMAALTALCVGTLKAGDRVVCSDVVYGGTVRLLRDILAAFDVEAVFQDSADLPGFEAAVTPGTRLVIVESPANPTLKLTDLRAVTEIAHRAGALIAVDNTFLTAVLQPVLPLGCDFAVYSTTKYIEGHNATVGGAILPREEAWVERFRYLQGALGIGQSPFEAWLTLRGLKTLTLRLEEHSRNALQVARFLEAHPAVARVHYPFLDSFPQVELARRQQRSGGGMLSFELVAGAPAGIALASHVQLCALAENLGAVETLVTHPASMTHAQIPSEERTALGITDGLVRLSVGLEDPADVISDLESALDAIGALELAERNSL